MDPHPSPHKLVGLLFHTIGGTFAMTAFMGLLLWATSPGPGFVPLASGVLGCLSAGLLGLFQTKAIGSLLPKGWIPATAAAGALGAPLSIAFAFPFLFVIGEFGIAIGGLTLGLVLGAGQFLLLRKRSATATWPWIPISSVALAVGFLVAFPLTSALHLGFYPPFSPGWTAVGAIAGFTYGLVTGLVTGYTTIGHRIFPMEDPTTRAA